MADEFDEDTWNKKQGAITYAGQFPSDIAGIQTDYNFDDPNIPNVILRKTMSIKNDNFKFFIFCDNNPDNVMLLKPDNDAPIKFTNNRHELSLSEITPKDMICKLLSKGPITETWNGKFNLELKCYFKGELFFTDIVAFRVAPILLSWNGQEKVKEYEPVPNIWLQDIMELTYSHTQKDDNKYGHVLVDLDHNDREHIYTDIINKENFWQVNFQKYDGNGGNIEVTPPSANNKFGRIIHGKGKVFALKAFLNAQKLQMPAVELNVGWLDVGHVDEVMSFVRNSRFMLASPVKAFDILQSEYENGNSDEEIKLGIDGGGEFVKEERYYSIKEILVYKRGNSVFVEGEITFGINKNQTTITIKGEQIFNNDDKGSFVRINDEFMMIDKVIGNAIIVIRGNVALRIPSNPSSHPPDSKIYRISDLQFTNLSREIAGKNSPRRIIYEEIMPELMKVGSYDQPFEIPVIFDFIGGRNSICAASSNMVNSLVYPGVGETIIKMPDPFNGSFKSYVNREFRKPFYKVMWQNCWAYHMVKREYHCKTNISRKPMKERWWNYE